MQSQQVSLYWSARTASGNHAVAEKKPNACAPSDEPSGSDAATNPDEYCQARAVLARRVHLGTLGHNTNCHPAP